MASNEQHQEMRARSYFVPPASDECTSGQGLIQPRDVAYLRYAEGPLAAGTCVRVHGFSNAGFRGIEANVTRCGHNDRWTVSAGNLDPVNPTLAAAVADGRIIETEDDCGTVCYAPAKGDGLTAEIFRLWVHLREDVARPARFSVTNAATAFAEVFASDTDVEGAIAALLTAHETWGTDRWPFGIPFVCRFCGAPSWVEPAEQVQPIDYCHPGDHELGL
jgi:hypothetical protein